MIKERKENMSQKGVGTTKKQVFEDVGRFCETDG
jgi:hypothetical protein